MCVPLQWGVSVMTSQLQLAAWVDRAGEPADLERSGARGRGAEVPRLGAGEVQRQRQVHRLRQIHAHLAAAEDDARVHPRRAP